MLLLQRRHMKQCVNLTSDTIIGRGLGSIIDHSFSSDGDTHPLIDVRQPPPEGASRQAADRDVRTENSGAGAQRVGRRLGLLKFTHPSLKYGIRHLFCL